MRILTGFKREIDCADWRICAVAALATWFAGGLSLLISGATGYYQLLCKPAIAPGTVLWLILWMGYYLLLGIALGLVLGRCGIGRRSLTRRGVVFWSLLLISSLLWVPLFFSAGLRVTALLLIVLAVSFGLCALSSFAVESLLSALLLLICLWWNIFSFLLTLLIILWN